MRKIIKITCFILLNFILSGKLYAQNNFTVNVKLKNPKHYTCLISYDDGKNPNKMDTSYVMQNGYMVFKGSIPEIGMINFVVRNPNLGIKNKDWFVPGPGLSFIARNGAVVTIDADSEAPYNAITKSTDKEIMTYETFRAGDKLFVSEIWDLNKIGAALPEDAKAKNEAKIKVLQDKQQVWAKEFVKKYPNSYAAIQVFATYALDLKDNERARQFAKLPATYKKSGLGAVIAEKIREEQATGLGKRMVPFSQKGYNGRMVSSAGLKGKVVLIDFWGSWCVPCRKSFPHLKELYSKYKSKGFEIVGLAQENGTLAQKMNAWKDAVKSDGINWLNILNDPAKMDIVKRYGVVQFPTKILIDRNGIIQYRSVGDGEGDLEKKLVALLEVSKMGQSGKSAL